MNNNNYIYLCTNSYRNYYICIYTLRIEINIVFSNKFIPNTHIKLAIYRLSTKEGTETKWL